MPSRTTEVPTNAYPERQWWAQRGKKLVGPNSSRSEAALAWFRVHPNSKAKDVMTGYGSSGPSFDIQWVSRAEVEAEWCGPL